MNRREQQKYRPPKAGVGELLYCHVAEADVVVRGFSDGPIAWPCTRRHPQGSGLLSLIVTDELLEAIRTESAAWLMEHLGVSEWTVTEWRKRFGVGWDCPGTRRARSRRGWKYKKTIQSDDPRKEG